MGKDQQADGYSGTNWHRFLKQHKRRSERRKAKRALHKGEEPVATYKRYLGYEL